MAERRVQMVERILRDKVKIIRKIRRERTTFAVSFWVTSPDNVRLTDLSGCQFKVFWLRFFSAPLLPSKIGVPMDENGVEAKFSELFMPDGEWKKEEYCLSGACDKI